MTKERGIKIVYLIILLLLVTFLFVNNDGVLKYFKLKTELMKWIRKLNSQNPKLKNLIWKLIH